MSNESSSSIPGSAPGERRVLIRMTGEIATKGRRTRARFQRALARNVRIAFDRAGIEAEVREEWSRLYARIPAGASADPLTRVFGISSFSLVDAEVPADLDAIVEVGRSLYAQRVKGRRFAVRARRSGVHDFRSADVMDRLGAALVEGATVDLRAPEIEVRVEVREGRAYLFASRTSGAGGLPLGVEGRAVSLLSGGFDSAVASWRMLRRGVALDYVFCNLGGDAYRRMVLEVAKTLADRWSFGAPAWIHVLEFGPVVDELRRAGRAPYLQLLLKRQMYAAADAIADRVGADAIVTGEAIGQVSSQTLANLRAIDGAIRRPVLRPLVGMDKEEIIAESRTIGTYALSARIREYCSISGGHPATAARPETVEAEERRIDDAVLGRAIAEAEALDLRRLRIEDLATSALFVDAIPDDAVVFDLRSSQTREAEPWPGARAAEYEELARGFERLGLSPTRPVVIVCAQGLLSARVAERMQEAGYEAYSLRGGERTLHRLAGAGSR